MEEEPAPDAELALGTKPLRADFHVVGEPLVDHDIRIDLLAVPPNLFDVLTEVSPTLG
jgi:hypothetical protein